MDEYYATCPTCGRTCWKKTVRKYGMCSRCGRALKREWEDTLAGSPDTLPLGSDGEIRPFSGTSVKRPYINPFESNPRRH